MTAKTTATVRRNLQLMDNNNNNNYTKNESHVEYNHIVVVYAFELYYFRYYTTVAYRMSSYFFACVYNTTIRLYPHYTLYTYVVDLMLYRLDAWREKRAQRKRYKIRSTINWTESEKTIGSKFTTCSRNEYYVYIYI